MSVNFSHLTIKPITKKEEERNISSGGNSTNHVPSISDVSKIMDSRTVKDFKDQVFGGYKLSAASAALDKALLEDKVEPALHWTLQLLLSGTIQPLWNKLINFACKVVNIYNPLLPEFLYNKTIAWLHITENAMFTSKDNVLKLRNHPTVRLLLAEMVTVLALSKKRKLNILPRIKKEEFIIDTFKAKLQAKDNSLVDGILADGDPSEIRIAANEMAFSLYGGNLQKGLYWLNWILEWEKINTKKYGKYECAARIIEGVDSKYYKDVVWLIWAIINKLRSLKFLITGASISSQMDYLWKMYCYKFTPGARARKAPLMIWAILYLTENVNMTVPLVDKPQVLFQSLLGMDKIVASLKSQEVHHIVNNDLLNVVVENNYMMPANYKQLEAEKILRTKEQERQHQQAQSVAKATAAKNKVSASNQVSMQKLNDVYKLDRMMYS
jgi:hypothetical protein